MYPFFLSSNVSSLSGASAKKNSLAGIGKQPYQYQCLLGRDAITPLNEYHNPDVGLNC